ncbi:Uncharacterised protein [Mycobacteroides abscessus subsp. abscessus]|nr:Uncharacterised protein [Mycobacteroides abscessus subsp. abscessus]
MPGLVTTLLAAIWTACTLCGSALGLPFMTMYATSTTAKMMTSAVSPPLTTQSRLRSAAFRS